MVLWCRKCGALLGVRVPYYDWTTDKTTLCTECVEAQPRPFDHNKLQDAINDRLEDSALKMKAAER
jgi:hypothetical protein